MQKEDQIDKENYLRKFLLEVRKLHFALEYMAQSVLCFKSQDTILHEASAKESER